MIDDGEVADVVLAEEGEGGEDILFGGVLEGDGGFGDNFTDGNIVEGYGLGGKADDISLGKDSLQLVVFHDEDATGEGSGQGGKFCRFEGVGGEGGMGRVGNEATEQTMASGSGHHCQSVSQGEVSGDGEKVGINGGV